MTIMESFKFCVDHKMKEGQKNAKRELILATLLENNSFAVRYINKAAIDPAKLLIKNKERGL